jgi:hypothetical protein
VSGTQTAGEEKGEDAGPVEPKQTPEPAEEPTGHPEPQEAG